MNAAREEEQATEQRKTAPQQKTRWRSAWSRIMWYLLAPTLLALCFSLGARWHWAPELATHFQVQYAMALLITLAAALWLKKKWTAVLSLAALAFVLWQIIPIYLPAEDPGEHGEAVRFLLANVHTGNRDYQRLLELVADEQPDVIVLLEVDGQWLKALTPLEQQYPHKVLRPRFDNFGLAVYSKRLLEDVQTEELADSEVPTVTAKLPVDGAQLTVIATHPLPPVSSLYANTRDRHLVALSHKVNALDVGTPAIVLGDLNTTSWSPRFTDLLESSGLRDSRQGFGIQGTWPLGIWPLGTGPLAIPLDHALVTPNVAVLNRRVGPSIGSDHRPVLVDLAVRTAH